MSTRARRTWRSLVVALTLALLGACGETSGSSESPSPDLAEDAAAADDTAEDPGADGVSDDSTGEDTAPDAGPDADPDLGDDDAAPDAADAAPDAAPDLADEPDAAVEVPGETVVRYIVMGDTGEGNENQYEVSRSAQARCDRAGGCHGFIMLGDNIYDDGAQNPTDPRLHDYIDAPYANLRYGAPPADGEEDTRPRMPIYVSLGNHDLGGAGLNSTQIAHYLEYARNNDWFVYPSEYWHRQVGVTHLISLHTNPLAYLGSTISEQATLIDQALGSTTAPWTIAFGHHPYRSEGGHGNAGEYEGLPLHINIFGEAFRIFVDEEICNRVDFYLCGHDHNRQMMASVPDIPNWPPATATQDCNTWFIVSGAGAKDDAFEGRDNELAFGAETRGFVLMELTADEAYIEFVDHTGAGEWCTIIDRDHNRVPSCAVR
jgi:tartrate-resistant acid phosphatase type 5